MSNENTAMDGQYSPEDQYASITKQTVVPPYEKEHYPDILSVMTVNGAAGNKPVPLDEIEGQIMRQTKIDLLESLEFIKAIVTADIPELRDGLTDKRITLNGFASFLPFSMSEDFDQAIHNQFTRFDRTFEDALATQRKYVDMGVATYIEENSIETNAVAETYFVNKVVADCHDTKGEFYNKGKFVKSVNFIKDDFTQGNQELLNPDSGKVGERWDALRTMLTNFISDVDAHVTNAQLQ